MIDHTGFTVSNVKKSKAFYVEAPRALRISLIMRLARKVPASARTTRRIPARTPAPGRLRLYATRTLGAESRYG